MKNNLFSIFCLLGLFCLLVLAKTVSAKTVYVHDKEKLWSRTGPSNEFKVFVKLLPGTRLDVLGENTETGYTQVKDIKQREFWIKSEYLTAMPTANIQLDNARSEIKKLSQQHKTKVQALDKRIKTMQPLENINQNLQTKIAGMNLEMEQLKQSNSAMSTRFYRDVFFAGGITIIAGILFGWFFGSRGRKRNSAWS